MKKLFLIVAVGCLFPAATSAAFGEGRQGPPHWPAPGQTQQQQAGAAGQIGPFILRFRPQIHRYRPEASDALIQDAHSK